MTVRTSLVIDEDRDPDIAAFLNRESPEHDRLMRGFKGKVSDAAVLRELLKLGSRAIRAEAMRDGYRSINTLLPYRLPAAASARGLATTQTILDGND